VTDVRAGAVGEDRPPVTAVVVVGLMGVGKTTVGRALAGRLGWPLDDSDASIEAREGRTVRQLRDELGTDEMHALEAHHLLDALAAPRPRVITPAAFTIEVPACREALRAPDLMVAWLRATPETLARRFAAGHHRPSYGDDPARFLADQARHRDPLFAELAPMAVDVDDATPDAAVGAILATLAERGTTPAPGTATLATPATDRV
jgi:shikimate kinase